MSFIVYTLAEPGLLGAATEPCTAQESRGGEGGEEFDVM